MKELSEKAKNYMACCLVFGMQCPQRIGLRDSLDCEGDNCRDCWKSALNRIRIIEDGDE